MKTLNLKFKNETSFEEAIIHFNEVSDFTPCEINQEFKSIGFEVSDSDDADNTESYIENFREVSGIPHNTESQNYEKGITRLSSTRNVYGIADWSTFTIMKG
jgi:hypothetical protein